HAVAQGKSIRLLPWMELMWNAFGVTEQDGDDMARQKIAGRLLLIDPQLHEALPILFEFLGVPDRARPAPRLTPEAMQREVFDIQKRLMQLRSRRGEFWAFLLEDLHWFDAASDAMLAALEELTPHTPTLRLTTFRPGYHAPWMQSPQYRQLALQPLGAEALAELLRDLLGTDPSVVPLTERLPERTGGNPFFIEEVVQALIETKTLVGTRGAYRLVRPVEELAIPPTVQAVLAARIDRLPEREKAVLQTAAVVGRELPDAVLRRIADLPEGELASAVRALIETKTLVGTRGAYRLVRPVEELAIPPTVQAVLAARIDRLPEREKAVLQTAAVVGRELPDAVLRRIADLPEGELASAVRALIAGEFL